MKRDWNLIHWILIESVQKCQPTDTEPSFMHNRGIDIKIIKEHLELLVENGYLKNYSIQMNEGELAPSVGLLTWKGYQLFDVLEEKNITLNTKEEKLLKFF